MIQDIDWTLVLIWHNWTHCKLKLATYTGIRQINDPQQGTTFSNIFSCGLCVAKTTHVREHRRGNKRTIQRQWQHSVHNTNKNKNMCLTPIYAKTCVWHQYTQNTNNVNKTCSLLQETWGKVRTEHPLNAEIVMDISSGNSERNDT